MQLPVKCVLARSLQAELCCSQDPPGNSISGIVKASKWSLQRQMYLVHVSSYKSVIKSTSHGNHLAPNESAQVYECCSSTTAFTVNKTIVPLGLIVIYFR